MPAIPGFAPPVKALCVVPQGMEEGTRAALPEEELALAGVAQEDGRGRQDAAFDDERTQALLPTVVACLVRHVLPVPCLTKGAPA